MLDIKLFREKQKEVEEMLRKRQVKLDLNHVIESEDERKKLIGEVESLRHTRKEVAEKKDIKKGREIKEKLAKKEAALAAVEAELEENLEQVPNVLSPEVPEGKSEEDSVEVKKWGVQTKFDFEPTDHLTL